VASSRERRVRAERHLRGDDAGDRPRPRGVGGSAGDSASRGGQEFPYRALIANPGAAISRHEQRIYARNLEVPSGGGVGTARAIARAYGVFATGGQELRLRPETLRALAAPASPAAHGFFDECLKGDVRFSLGFMKPSPSWPFGSEASFGSPGSGGSLGFADPEADIGYAYVTGQMGTALTGDPRDVALRNAVYSVIQPAPQAVGFTR
jgi:CubicO group peptidase (beta-lactamase class C family)